MSVSVSVFAHVCVYVCVYMCVYVFVSMCMYVCAYACVSHTASPPVVCDDVPLCRTIGGGLEPDRCAV